MAVEIVICSNRRGQAYRGIGLAVNAVTRGNSIEHSFKPL